jgi:hypothetical protein
MTVAPGRAFSGSAKRPAGTAAVTDFVRTSVLRAFRYDDGRWRPVPYRTG